MPPDFERSYSVIKQFLSHHVPDISISLHKSSRTLKVKNSAMEVVIPCSWDDLSDLEEALTNRTHPASYINGLVRDVTLRALVEVGKQGMAPDVDVSTLIVDEKLDWRTTPPVVTSFDDETAQRLYEGLKVLDAVAAELASSDVPVPEIDTEHKIMAGLIAYYEDKRHLSSSGVSGQSLAYLKAAAFCWILALQEKKNAVMSRRVRSAQSARIFELVERFWLLHPFDRIALPPIVRDYLAHKSPTAKSAAAIPGPGLDIGPQLRSLDPRLEERWRGAWQALQSANPDKVSQAANSMVEVLDKVISRICGDSEFSEVLAERYPGQEKVILTQRSAISALKQSLHSVKHQTNTQSVHSVEDLMHAAEGIIRTLLRVPPKKS